jgi:hypothetical protein
MSGISVVRSVHFVRRGHGARKQFKAGAGAAAPRRECGSVPRVARLMALAIRFEQLIRDGVVADYAELARLGHVTRARLSQIMNLLVLAPDIQEAILFLPRTAHGSDPIHERDLRPIAKVLAWSEQRRLWVKLLGETANR